MESERCVSDPLGSPSFLQEADRLSPPGLERKESHARPARRLLAALLPTATLATPRAEMHAAVFAAEQGGAANGRVAELRSVVLRLYTRRRAGRRLRPLRVDPALRRAARRHAEHMVSAGFFAHTTPAGTTPGDRVRRAGYARGGRILAVGENLAWGTGRRARPAAILRRWMASGPHRAHITSRRFRDIGIGVAVGTPAGGVGVTYAVQFGVRGARRPAPRPRRRASVRAAPRPADDPSTRGAVRSGRTPAAGGVCAGRSTRAGASELAGEALVRFAAPST